MKALFKLNCLYIQKMLIYFIPLIIVMMVIDEITSSNASSIAMMCCLVLSMDIVAFDCTTKHIQTLLLPITREEYVLGKYLFIIFVISLFTFLFIGINVITNSSPLNQFLFSLFFSNGFLLLTLSISIPCIFKFGREKWRYISIIAIMFIMMSVTASFSIFEELNLFDLRFMNSLNYVMIASSFMVGMICIFAGSYFISCKIIKQKEF